MFLLKKYSLFLWGVLAAYFFIGLKKIIFTPSPRFKITFENPFFIKSWVNLANMHLSQNCSQFVNLPTAKNAQCEIAQKIGRHPNHDPRECTGYGQCGGKFRVAVFKEKEEGGGENSGTEKKYSGQHCGGKKGISVFLPSLPFKPIFTPISFLPHSIPPFDHITLQWLPCVGGKTE